ncbi:MAG: PAS domain S-box protein [Chitinophagaceae bacterium]|nr:PAS domain S-box protein [Chitinophagaceae bacterium]
MKNAAEPFNSYHSPEPGDRRNGLNTSNVKLAAVPNIPIDQIPDGIIVFTKLGQILYFNEAAASCTGYSQDEFRGLNINDLFQSETGEIPLPEIEQPDGAQFTIGQRIVTCKNGTPADVQLSVKSLQNGNMLAIARDTSERSHEERERDFDSNNLKALINNTNDLMWSVDCDLRLITFNKAFDERMRSVLGKQLMKGSNVFSIGLNDDSMGQMTEYYNRALAGENFTETEYTHLPTPTWTELSFYPILQDKEVLGTACHSRDVTQSRLATQLLNKAHEKNSAILESIRDAFFSVDKNWVVTYWNKEAERILSMPRANIIGNHFWDVYANAVETKSYVEYHRAMDEEVQVSFEDFYPPLGRWFEITAYPSDEGLSVFFKEITERKERENAFRELNEKLNARAEELLDSNKELERFAYIASHDLQEPLRMVSSFVKLLEKKYKSQLDETANQYITFAVEGAERMNRLILDLLEYSRAGSNSDLRVETDMSVLVNQVLATFSDKIRDTGTTIKVHLMPNIVASPTQMTQVLQNLVSNALKYNQSAVPTIEIGSEDKGDHWQFFIKDNGIGIDEKFYERVFLIFQRLHNKNNYSGTGIGLAICKKIIDRHNGSIWIESEFGKGTSFLFTIKKTDQTESAVELTTKAT